MTNEHARPLVKGCICRMACLHGRLAARLQCLVRRHRAHVSWRPPQPSARAASAAAVRRCQPGAAGCRHWRSRRLTTTPARAVELEAPQLVPARPLVGERMSWEGRSAACGELRPEREGDALAVCGWVHRQRNLGGVCFVDVRDSSGLLQARAPGGEARPELRTSPRLSPSSSERGQAARGRPPPAPLRHGLRSRLPQGCEARSGARPSSAQLAVEKPRAGRHGAGGEQPRRVPGGGARAGARARGVRRARGGHAAPAQGPQPAAAHRRGRAAG